MRSVRTTESLARPGALASLQIDFPEPSIAEFSRRAELLPDGPLALLERRAANGATPLIIASQEGNAEIVTMLLEAGAKPDVRAHAAGGATAPPSGERPIGESATASSFAASPFLPATPRSSLATGRPSRRQPPWRKSGNQPQVRSALLLLRSGLNRSLRPHS